MKYYKQILAGMCLSVFMLMSCEPRIEFDWGQWGDQAFITDIQIFILQEEDHRLQEYYDKDELTTGVRRQFLNTSSLVDDEAASIIVSVPSNVDLTNVGLVIRHTAVKIEPLNGAPRAGYLNDFSGGPYVYRVTSADGTQRDWTIIFDVG